MGDDIRMGFYVKVKPEKIVDLEKVIERVDKKDGEYFLELFLHNAKVSQEGEIQFWSCCSHFYVEMTEEFALFIKDYVSKGSMEFSMLDEDTWGYDFDGNGGVTPYVCVASKKKDKSTMKRWKAEGKI